MTNVEQDAGGTRAMTDIEPDDWDLTRYYAARARERQDRIAAKREVRAVHARQRKPGIVLRQQARTHILQNIRSGDQGSGTRPVDMVTPVPEPTGEPPY